MDRCARGLHSRKRQLQEPQQEPRQEPQRAPQEEPREKFQQEPQQETRQEPQQETQEVTQQDTVENSVISPPVLPDVTLPTFDDAEQNALLDEFSMSDLQTVFEPFHPSGLDGRPDNGDGMCETSDLPVPVAEVRSPSTSQLSPRAAAPHVVAYFTHFQPFFPVIHKPSFSLSSSPRYLLSIVVAIGSLYSVQSGSSEDIRTARVQSRKLWADGAKTLEDAVNKDSSAFHEHWTLQAWLLHVVYGFFYGDETCSVKSKSMLQILVDNIRTLGLLNQDLTFPPHVLWTSDLNNLGNWDEAVLSQAWSRFASQEAIRICVYALIFCDVHIASPCNTRTLISTAESNWDLPPSKKSWEAVSAEKWFEEIQEEMEQGVLASPTNSSNHRSQSVDRLTLLRATQSLLAGKPTPTLLKRLSRSPFATLCVIANIDCLVRDFTHCYYQLPPALPDPSAFHVLSQHQNRSVNSALTTLLRLTADGSHDNTNISSTIQLHCWATRLSLCEPDDLLISGIADTTISGGLATSAHLILGSHVANRRATVSTQRKFGEDSSMTVWDDLLKCLALIFQSSRNNTSQEPPWVTVLSYRALLVLWRTLRRAVAELSQQAESSAGTAHYFNPARIIVSIVCERARRYMGEDDMADSSQWEDLTGIEIDYICLVIKMFSKKNASPVNKVVEDIMQEIVTLISSGEG